MKINHFSVVDYTTLNQREREKNWAARRNVVGEVMGIDELAKQYAQEVEARRRLGDSLAEYHSRDPKIEAYRLLMEQGLSPQAAIEAFQLVCIEHWRQS